MEPSKASEINKHPRVSDRLYQKGNDARASIQHVVELIWFYLVFLDILDEHFPDHHDDVVFMRWRLAKPKFSLVRIVEKGLEGEKTTRMLRSAVDAVLGGRKTEDLLAEYEERVRKHSGPRDHLSSVAEIHRAGDPRDCHPERIFFKGERSVEDVYPSWEEALACMAHGVMYDVWS